MERKEVSNCLELIKNIILNSDSWCGEAKIVVEKCFNTAIKNLEAWDKVKEAISKEQIELHAKLFEVNYEDLFELGRHSAFVEVLEIIEKNLSEVSE